MGLRINVPLPGPLSYSMRATPRVKPIVRAMRSSSPPQRHTCDCTRPTVHPQPQNRTMGTGRPAEPSTGSTIGGALLAGLVLILIIVALNGMFG